MIVIKRPFNKNANTGLRSVLNMTQNAVGFCGVLFSIYLGVDDYFCLLMFKLLH